MVSGIAVSFDGQTSRYLPLPPLLPSRSAAWHQPPSDCADHDRRTNGGGSRVEPGSSGKGVGVGRASTRWESLPGGVLESIALFVSFRVSLEHVGLAGSFRGKRRGYIFFASALFALSASFFSLHLHDLPTSPLPFSPARLLTLPACKNSTEGVQTRFLCPGRSLDALLFSGWVPLAVRRLRERAT